MRKFTVLLTALLVLTASPVIPDEAPEGGNGPYPIWLSPLSPVQSVEQIGEEWTRQFGEGVEDREQKYFSWKFHKGEGADRKTAIAENCQTIFALEEQGYLAPEWPGRRLYNEQRSGCDLMVMLRTARPAKRSFVQNFKLNEKALGVLPAFLEIAASCQGVCQNQRADERGVPLSAYIRIGKVVPRSPNELHITPAHYLEESEGIKPGLPGGLDITWLGRADFTGDGLEDLVVRAEDWSPPPHTWRGTDIFVLTRSEPGAVLRVVEPGQYLCRDYTCPTDFPWVDDMPAGPQ